VHDGTVGLDRSADDIIVVFEIDDYNFRGCTACLRFANADE
jgi:hypothetical protein